MKRLSLCITLLALTCNFGAHAQQEDNYDYFTDNRTVIRTGVQAVLMCNGLFTGGRTLEQVFGQELAYLTEPRFSGANGSVDDVTYEIDHDRKAVAVTEPDNGQTIRAAFREGIGCVVMAPDQTFDDIDSLPMLDLPYPDFDPATTPWPNGDLVAKKPLPANVDAQALQAASDWAFSGDTPGFVTLSLLVVHNGDIIHDAPGPPQKALRSHSLACSSTRASWISTRHSDSNGNQKSKIPRTTRVTLSRCAMY
jgi:hypothetical protein